MSSSGSGAEFGEPGMMSGGGLGGMDDNQPIPVTVTSKYRFTPDELRALRECNRESFYFRCLPFGSFFAGGTYYAIKGGYLTPHTRFGPWPKMFIAATVGYFIGKFSYQHKCVEKIMALPNSPLAEILKKQRGKIGFQESLSLEPGFSTASLTADLSNDKAETSGLFTDVGDTQPLSSFDADSFGMEYGRSIDNELQMKEDTLPPKSPQFFTAYDDLRRQNREEYEKRANNTGLQGVGDGGPGPRRYAQTNPQQQQPNQAHAPVPQPRSQQRNIYGDVWDDKPQQ